MRITISASLTKEQYELMSKAMEKAEFENVSSWIRKCVTQHSTNVLGETDGSETQKSN